MENEETTTLLEAGCAADLHLRGFDREQVLQATGEDVGYNGRALREQLSGTDRRAYRGQHVRQRVCAPDLDRALAEYAAGGSREQLLGALGLGATAAVKVREVLAGAGLGERGRAAESARRTATMRAGMVAAHGVPNPFELRQVQAAAAATRLDRYGAAYTLSEGSSLAEGARESIRARMADPDGRAAAVAARAATLMASTGYDHPMRDPRVLSRRRLRSLLSHGTEHPSQTQAARQAQSGRMGREAALRAAKARRTWRQKYGVDHPSQREASRVRQSERMLREGAIRAEKARRTSSSRYGVDHPSQRPSSRRAVSELMRRTARRRALASRRTSMERYGVDHPSQREASRAQQSERMLSRTWQERVVAARARNGTMRTSAPEQELGRMLEEFFGAGRVLAQHRDDRYPWAVDFYVPDRDLFVELNASWTHGGHWYDPDRPADVDRLGTWSGHGSAYYDNAARTWSERDVAKRAAAAEHGLNYVVLWSPALDDAALWLALGAPDGQDWRREHSWLPGRDLDPWPQAPQAGPGTRQLSAMARWAQWETFHARELALWEADEPVTKWGRTRGWLLSNRLRHLGKTPGELSDREVLRGFGASALLRPYTVFDTTAMRSVLEELAPASVVDPCAGWGERMLLCAEMGIGYEGTDVSAEAVRGHGRLVEQYGLEGVRTRLADGAGQEAAALMRSCEAVVTCPPYGGTELYTDRGAEHLPREQFLAWWEQVGRSAAAGTARFFAYQVNERWAGPMDDALARAGWRLERVVPCGGVRASHLNRRGGSVTKSQTEAVRVLVRA